MAIFKSAYSDNPYTFLFKGGNNGKKVNFIQSLPEPPPTWDLGIETTAINQTFSITLFGTNPNIIINWGDGTEETFTTTGNKTHQYSLAGNYTIKIKGSFDSDGRIQLGSTISENSRVKSTSVIPAIPGLNSFVDSFVSTSITSLPSGMFDNHPNVISFAYCFENCSNLSSIPSGLFSQNTLVTSFSNCFSNTALTSVPSNLFANNLNVTNLGFGNVFVGITLNTESYSNLLVNIASNSASRQNNISFGGGNSKYNLTGQTARQTLEAKGWTFEDGGFDTNNILFDTTSFVGTVPEPYLTALNAAVARWSTYIKFNPTIVASIRSQINSNWGGIKINSYSTINDSNSYIAACGVNEYIDIEGGGGVKFNTYTFNLFVNLYYASILSPTDWANVMTHELGHALGIGIYWGTEFQAGGAVPPSDFFLSSTAYPSAGGAYNTILGSSRPKISLENEGGGGTASAHWENSFRPSSAAGSEGFDYPGLQNELMVGFYSPSTNFVISDLSIKTLVDFGYVEKNAGVNEGVPTLVNS